MTITLPRLFHARIVIETTTGLSIASGESDPSFDTLLVRDAHGLPAIPGSSLAGVLRQRVLDLGGDESIATRLFGVKGVGRKKSVAGAAEKIGADGWEASRVRLSWGAFHDANNRPVDGLPFEPAMRRRLVEDDLLRLGLAVQPVQRDHVRLNSFGAAADRGKFERVSVPAGCRFTVDVSLATDDAYAVEDEKWLKRIVLSPGLRLGGATRRGLGAVVIRGGRAGWFDLREAADLDRFGRLPVCLDEEPEKDVLPNSLATEYRKSATDTEIRLDLEAVDFCRFGQGDKPLTKGADGKPADQLPLTTTVVHWKDGKATIMEDAVLIPWSGIKGALRHRFGYHVRRLQGAFQPPEGPVEKTDVGDLAANALFGEASDESGVSTGQAGHLVVDDLVLASSRSWKSPQVQQHNGIDRFTGGVRRSVLFGEELLYGLRFELKLQFVERDRLERGLPTKIRLELLERALRATLDDLLEERLALGGGASKGHGFFRSASEKNIVPPLFEGSA